MKRHIMLLLLMVLVLGILVPPMWAQDGGDEGCTPEDIETGMALATSLHERIGKALDEDDLETAQIDSAALTEHLANFYDACGDINAAPNVTIADRCLMYPTYCVPHFAASMLLIGSQGVEGVVRGVNTHGYPSIGDPAAPIHFRVVSAPACAHCWEYFLYDIRAFIDTEVLQGRATMSYALLTTTGGGRSEGGAAGAICAGRQRRFWEFLDAMWSVVDDRGEAEGLSHEAIVQRARELGLDMPSFNQCIQSAETQAMLDGYQTFANDHGVSGTPTLLVSYGDSGEWTPVESGEHGYDNMVALTAMAND